MPVCLVTPQLLFDIADHTRLGMFDRPRTERMGLLFGQPTRVGVRLMAYSPYRGGWRGPDYFEYEPEKIRERATELARAADLRFLGMYHSHPLRRREKIPQDLIFEAQLSDVDRALFREVDWSYLEVVVALGRGRQAPQNFSIDAERVWFVRRKGEGYYQFILRQANTRIWLVQGRLSWFFVFAGWTHGREGQPEPVRFALDIEGPYRGLVTGDGD